MPAYLVVDIDIHDRERYQRYIQMAPPTIAVYGGRYLTRGGETSVLEGDWVPKRFVVLEFPSMERARAWWSSPEYAEAKALRQSCATTRMVVAEGLPTGVKIP
ncbi:MAG TPA: DUF1330 domain-containing protein [Gemmatimonadaceae bacterium]|nr:DUF1330 domain-containing protein [Gemmatimonadaceae bacterium]